MCSINVVEGIRNFASAAIYVVDFASQEYVPSWVKHCFHIKKDVARMLSVRGGTPGQT